MEKMIIQSNTKNLGVITLVAILLVLSIIIISLAFNLSLVQNLTLSWISTTVYSLFAYFVIDNRLIRQTERIVERPVEVIREVPIQVPIENKTIEVVEKIVTRNVPVYVREERSKIKLALSRDNYLASSETKRYHTKNCRFGKLIKNKYKIHNNNLAFFKEKHFMACKMCIKVMKKEGCIN